MEPAEGSDGTDGRWRIARKVAGDRVVSAVDRDARHTRKSPEARRDGYRAHVAADPETGIITDEQLTKAAGQDNSDPAVADRFLAREAAGEDTDRTGAAGQAPDGAGAGDSDGDRDGEGDGGLAWYGSPRRSCRRGRGRTRRSPRCCPCCTCTAFPRVISCPRWGSSWALPSAGLSAAVVTGLTETWKAGQRAFAERDLSGVDYVYLWADGIHVNIRLEEHKL